MTLLTRGLSSPGLLTRGFGPAGSGLIYQPGDWPRIHVPRQVRTVVVPRQPRTITDPRMGDR